MIDIKNLFKNSIEGDLAEQNLSPEQRWARGRMISELLNSEGFVALDKFVSAMQGSVMDEIANSKTDLEVMKHQGEFIGAIALRRAIQAILTDAEEARKEIEKAADPDQN